MLALLVSRDAKCLYPGTQRSAVALPTALRCGSTLRVAANRGFANNASYTLF